MTSSSRTVALDLDSVMYPLLHGMARLPGGERVAYHTCPSWAGLADQCEGGLKGMLALFEAAMTHQHMSSIGTFPGVPEGVKRLHEAGLATHVMTERPAVVAEDTKRWVAEVIAPHAVTVDQPFDKVALCRQLGIELIVEDNPATIEAAHAAGMTVVCARYLYNREVIDRLGLPYVEMTDEQGEVRPAAFDQLIELVLAAAK